jgi:hypothetical protein
MDRWGVAGVYGEARGVEDPDDSRYDFPKLD